MMNIGSKCLKAIFATGARKPQKNWIEISIKYVFALPAGCSFVFVIILIPC